MRSRESGMTLCACVMVDVFSWTDCAEARNQTSWFKCLPGGAPVDGLKGHRQFQVHLSMLLLIGLDFLSVYLSPALFLFYIVLSLIFFI